MNEKKENIDLNKKYEAIENKLKEGFDGKIIDIIPMTNTEYFGEDGLYGEKEGFKIVYEVEGNSEDLSQWFNNPKDTGLTNPKCNMYQFKQKYKVYPKIGVPIRAVINDDGFFEIEF